MRTCWIALLIVGCSCSTSGGSDASPDGSVEMDSSMEDAGSVEDTGSIEDSGSDVGVDAQDANTDTNWCGDMPCHP